MKNIGAICEKFLLAAVLSSIETMLLLQGLI